MQLSEEAIDDASNQYYAYTYDGDKLTKVTSILPDETSENEISYDNLGNITGYKDNTITWQGQRAVSINGIAMQYDYKGLRTRKGERYYYWLGNTLKMERWGENTIYYYYDESGVSGFRYNNIDYYFYKNIFGDVLAIYDVNGNLQCTYEYDAWGNHKIYNQNGAEINKSTIHIGNINPIRYRGYYWDADFNLYYLQSRYYSPELCRFISPDSVGYLDPTSINGLNLYAYCLNNPVMYCDPSGHSVILAMLIGAGIGLVVGLGSQLASDVISNVITNGFDFSEWEMSSWQTYVGAGLGGAIGGALTPFLGPVATGFITGASSTAISMGLSNITGASNYSLGEIFATSLLIGSVSSITAGILDNVKIPGINSGRGSLTAVSKQINTKLVNGSIKNVSIKTIGKMAALNAIYSAPFTVFNGLFTNGAVISPAY